MLLDASVAAALVYLGVCIYELTNYAALSALGAQASLTFWGGVPIGVSASVTQGDVFALVKPLQIALSTLMMLGLFRIVRSLGLRNAETLALSIVSIYIASAYWELFSSVGALSYEAHTAIFIALAIGAQFGLTTLFGASRGVERRVFTKENRHL